MTPEVRRAVVCSAGLGTFALIMSVAVLVAWLTP